MLKCVFLGLINSNLSSKGCNYGVVSLCRSKRVSFTEGTGEETPTTNNKVFSQSLGPTLKKGKVKPAKKAEKL